MMLSIIIPMYNAEDTIERCINSVIDCKNFLQCKVIIINDGSNDKSKKIVQEYVQKYDNILLYNKENGGVSSARNRGLEFVNTDWLCFLDADDVLEINAVDYMVYYTQKYPDSECIIFSNNIDKEYEETLDKNSKLELLKSIINSSSKQRYSTCHMASPCSKIYKIDVVKKNRISFSNDIVIGEDMLFNIQYFSNITNIVWINKGLYFYYKNYNSITNTFLYNILESDKRYQEKLYSLIKSYDLIDAYQHNILGGIWVCLMRFFSYNKDGIFNQRKMLKELVSSTPYVVALERYKDDKFNKKNKRIVFLLLKNNQYFLVLLIIKINRYLNVLKRKLYCAKIKRICI